MQEPSQPEPCINCNRPVTGNYCAHCGQPRHVPRITLGHLFHDMQSKLFGFDGKVANTFMGMLRHPGKVGREYMAGNRVKYSGPLSWYFLMFMVMLGMFPVFGVDFSDFMTQISDQINESAGVPQPDMNNGLAAADTLNLADSTQQLAPALTDSALVAQQKLQAAAESQRASMQFAQNLQQTIFSNFQTFSASLIPIMAFFTWLMHRRKGYNYTETVAFLFYAMSQSLLITMATVIIYGLTGVHVMIYALPFSILYISYTLYQWYNYKYFIKALLRTILIFLLN